MHEFFVLANSTAWCACGEWTHDLTPTAIAAWEAHVLEDDEDDELRDWNREGDPAFNGAFDRW